MGTTASFTSPGCRRPSSEGVPWAQPPNSCSLSKDLYRLVPRLGGDPNLVLNPWALPKPPVLPNPRGFLGGEV